MPKKPELPGESQSLDSDLSAAGICGGEDDQPHFGLDPDDQKDDIDARHGVRHPDDIGQ